MLRKAFRVIITLCGMLLGYGVSTLLIEYAFPAMNLELVTWMTVAVTCVLMATIGIIFFILYPTLIKRGDMALDDMQKGLSKIPTSELVTGVAGLVIGLIVAFLISQIVNNINVLKRMFLNTVISVLLYTFLGFAGATLSTRLIKDVKLPMPSVPQPQQQSGKTKNSKQKLTAKVIDTSVIIDGRIVDILKTGFLEGDIIIADFVLVELRHLADSADDLKRAKGRRGLDIVTQIQKDYGIEIYDTKSDKAISDIDEVDLKLLKLAKDKKGSVLTNDFNLNKVAGIEGVKVLNINELANALKPVVIPGETMQVYLVKEGKEPGQGVAYLDDGTMIVIEGGKGHIGKTVAITVTSVLQTAAGRMIFGKL